MMNVNFSFFFFLRYFHVARLASYPCVGAVPGELWKRMFEARKAPWEGQKKQPHATVKRHARRIFWLTLPMALFPF